MNVLNAKYKNTKINWGNITLPLLPGTPIGADGTIQNDADAVGIVTDRFDTVPFLPELPLLVAGDVDASQILYELSDEAKAALGGIRVFAADGSFSQSMGFNSKDLTSYFNIDSDIELSAEELNLINIIDATEEDLNVTLVLKPGQSVLLHNTGQDVTIYDADGNDYSMANMDGALISCREEDVIIIAPF